jgi:predicted HTH domain antitoxin
MGMITIELPESVLLATGWSRDEFVREAKLILAAKLFEEGRISSGKGAEICRIPRVDFLLEMGRRGIPVIRLDEEELKREFGNA